MSFLDLPNELCSHLFGYLNTEVDRNALKNLCLVNKATNILAEPLLYSVFSELSSSSADNLNRLSTPARVQLVNALCSRPLRSFYLQSLGIDISDTNFGNGENTSDTESVRLADRDTGSIHDVSNSSFLDSEIVWAPGVQSLEIQVLAKLLISKAPNLTSLSVLLSPGRLEPLVELAKRATALPAGLPILYFSKLKHLTLGNTAPVEGFSLSEVDRLFLLPSLETFSAWGCLDSNMTSPRLALAPSSSNISAIILQHAAVDEQTLALLLASSRRLHTFAYEACGFFKLNDDEKFHFSATELYSALKRHEESLNTLLLDFDVLDYPTLLTPQLRDMTNLQNISLNWDSLGETMESLHCLPSSIESLGITNCRWPVELFLMKREELKDIHLLKLRKVYFSQSESEMVLGVPNTCSVDEFVCACAEFGQDLKAKGVELLFRPYQTKSDHFPCSNIDEDGWTWALGY